jgi:quinol monooxygenase YgiN
MSFAPSMSRALLRPEALNASFANEEEASMLKSIRPVVAALVVAGALLLPIRGHEASAQSESPYVNLVEIDIVPGEIEHYLSALKENAEAAVKQEPGCREFHITVSQKDPNHVVLLEVYDSAAALDAHRATDHFKKYASTTKEMIAKREPRPFSLVATYMKGS